MAERVRTTAISQFRDFYRDYVGRLEREKPHGAIDAAAAETVAMRIDLAIDRGATTEQISAVIKKVVRKS